MSKWRDRYKVHPAADVIPMMGEKELADLQADIKANGQRLSVAFWKDGRLLDGRNRLEAMERLCMKTDRGSIHADTLVCGDPLQGLSRSTSTAAISPKSSAPTSL